MAHRQDWVRRIIVQLRTADERQLRDIFFLVKGYIGTQSQRSQNSDSITVEKQ